MRCARLSFLLVIAGLSGCAMSYSLVNTGVVAVEGLNVEAGSGWNRAPGIHTPSNRRDAETWTRDGMLLDRLVIIPAIADGEAIMVSKSKSAALPVFKADMLPNELEELVESSMVKTFGEGQSVVSTENLRPNRFGERAGILFDLTATVSDGPQYRGTVGAFIADDKLYLIYFVAAVPFYYDKHIADAEAIIRSATL